MELDGREQTVTRESIVDAAPAADTDGPTPVLLVDGYELLEPLDQWVREEFVPSLPSDAVTVLAGRLGPSTAWRSDPGWRQLMVVHELRNFDVEEATELLTRAGVPPDRHERLLALARGHPLALALLAEVAIMGRVPDDLVDAPDVVEALLPVFVDTVPDDAHALGLEICAYVWLTTEELLIHTLGNDARTVWRWLEALPFVVRGPLGVHPHELARDVLRAEYARRSPSGRLRVHRLVHRYAGQVVRERPPEEAHAAALQLLYLHKDSPLIKGFWALRDSESVTVRPGRASDHAEVIELIGGFEGSNAAQLARRWLDAQDVALRVVQRDREPVAFALEPVVPADASLEADDPVTRSVLEEVSRQSPLRPGEQISIGRFFGGWDGYQTDPYAVMCGSVSSLMTWSTHALAWSWIVTVSPEFWAPIFDYLGFDQRLEIAGDATRSAFGFDWRRIGFDTWVDVMTEREVSGETGPMPRHVLLPPPLDRSRFEDAVRAGLRTIHEPDELARNPLLGSRILEGPRHDADGLADALRSAFEALGGTPGGDELRSVLDRTFLRPATTQEAAAEVLDLSFSTYRRRLGKATEALTDLLWAVEIGERRLTRD